MEKRNKKALLAGGPLRFRRRDRVILTLLFPARLDGGNGHAQLDLVRPGGKSTGVVVEGPNSEKVASIAQGGRVSRYIAPHCRPVIPGYSGLRLDTILDLEAFFRARVVIPAKGNGASRNGPAEIPGRVEGGCGCGIFAGLGRIGVVGKEGGELRVDQSMPELVVSPRPPRDS